MLWKKGDVIECVLAESLLTGDPIEPELLPHRHRMQSSFRVFNVAIDDLYRSSFCDWTGPPSGSQMVNVAGLSAMMLLAYTMHSADVPEAYRLHFKKLGRSALQPLKK